MKIYKSLEEVKPIKNAVVTTGTFDGVHLGHRSLIDKMNEMAASIDGETVILTFDPHPRRVLYPDSWDLKLINSQQRKIDLLSRTGVGHLIIIPFTIEFSAMNPLEFIKDIIVEKIGGKTIVVGYDHHFGKNRLGNYNSLNEIGRELGFTVEELPAQIVEDIPVSSSKIRKLLHEGNIKLANQLLGYEYSIMGKVVYGYQVGKTIGFPTANLEVEDKLKLIAANGVYACKILYRNEKLIGMGNIGFRPTLDRKDLTIEVNIFDFEKIIYGDKLTIYWIDRIRDEVKFNNLEELKNQLIRDRKTVKNILGHP